MFTLDLNWWAILLSALVYFIIGMTWYSPLLFGNIWMKLSGIKMDKNKKPNMTKPIIVAILSNLVLVFVLSNLNSLLGYASFMEGAWLGFFVWLGFVAPIAIEKILWEGKPVKLYLINVIYHLVGLLIAGGILSAWQ